VNVPGIVQRHPAVRWLAPAGVIIVAALAAAGVFRSEPTATTLPQMTPDALVAAVRSTPSTSFSGTVVSRVSLGLPEVPTVVSRGDTTSLATLLSGSHTLRVWYGGRHAQRIALLGATDETDLFRSGRHLWQWSSSDRVAVHTVLPAAARRAVLPLPDASNPVTLTPSGIAEGALAAAASSTRVTVGGNLEVADRSAYELVLTPRSRATRVGSVHIAVDGTTKVPLGVQVYPRDSDTPAVDIAFTSIRFGTQSESNFSFAPPPGAKVHRASDTFAADRPGHFGAASPAKHRQVRVSGEGWTSVLRYSGSTTAVARLAKTFGATRVTGSWGSGRLFETPLGCALVIQDGRAYVGAVDPAALFAAAAAR
jgi:hypothetical protein